MYMDPDKIRTHTIKLRMNEDEFKLVEALVNYTGEQRAVLLREMIISQATSLISGNNSAHKQAV